MGIRETIERLREMERVATRPWQSGPTGILHHSGEAGGWVEYHGAASPTVLSDWNCEFIAEMRNALPTLLALAALAIEARPEMEKWLPGISQDWLARFDALTGAEERGT